MEETRTYTPEPLPRQGEINAWVFALLVTVGMTALHVWAQIPAWAWIFAAFLYFSACSISLGNWMDRHTRIQLSETGVSYENGLRNVSLAWGEIMRVQLGPARWGQSVQVRGLFAHFEFNTLGEVKFRGELRGKTGFTNGDFIRDEIVRLAHLHVVEAEKPYIIYSRM